MRLKTFLASYALFLFLLFGTIGIISTYLTHSQTTMLKSRSLREYQTISISLANDMATIADRLDGDDFLTAVQDLVAGYSLFYSSHNIRLTLAEGTGSEIEAVFLNPEPGTHLVNVRGPLRSPFENFQLRAYLDLSEPMADMAYIQRMLLDFALIFAVIGAGAFHWILGIIFKPLDTIATASREIADGQFEKRITIDGQGELASMARDFNQMAETVQQQISFLEEESLQKQAFVDNFAYEIRTPLTSIMGYAQYMQRASMTEDELIDSLGYILDESAYMKDIANSLLDLATLRNFTPVTAKISLKEFSEEVEQGLAASLKEKNVRFSCATDSDFFFGPRDLLKSLAMNLCLNGIKACEPGRGHVFLRISSDFMEVSDNGHGIPAAELKKVTEPFYRVDKDRSRHVGGAGLGLALCQQIATVHGGSLSISSVEGEGTTVMVRLPGGENHA